MSASLMPPAQHSVNCVIDANTSDRGKIHLHDRRSSPSPWRNIYLYSDRWYFILMNVNETVKIGRVFFRVNQIHLCDVRSKLISYMCLLHQTLASHLTCLVTKSHVQWSIHWISPSLGNPTETQRRCYVCNLAIRSYFPIIDKTCSYNFKQ